MSGPRLDSGTLHLEKAILKGLQLHNKLKTLCSWSCSACIPVTCCPWVFANQTQLMVSPIKLGAKRFSAYSTQLLYRFCWLCILQGTDTISLVMGSENGHEHRSMIWCLPGLPFVEPGPSGTIALGFVPVVARTEGAKQ